MLVTPSPESSALRGVDVFLESPLTPDAVAHQLSDLTDELRLTMISNRGTQVWPTGSNFTDCVNHYRVRFEAAQPVSQQLLVALLAQVADRFPLCSAEWLREVDGLPAYSLAQGQA